MEFHVEMVWVIDADDIEEAQREADAFVEGNEPERIMWTTIVGHGEPTGGVTR